MQNVRLSTAHVKFYKICNLISSFCWKYIQFQQKGTEELCAMTMNSDAKFEEKPICFKNDKNLMHIDLSTQKSQKFALWLVLSCKLYNISPKKYRGVIFHDTDKSCKIWRKTDLCSGKRYEEFGNFHQNPWQYQNWDFGRIILSKIKNAWAKTLQRSYLWWHCTWQSQNWNFKAILLSKVENVWA